MTCQQTGAPGIPTDHADDGAVVSPDLNAPHRTTDEPLGDHTVKIAPFLWYDRDLAEVLSFYRAIFDDFRVINSTPGAEGSVMMATFEMAGQEIMALNGGPMYTFTEAVSLFVSVGSQEEVDVLWSALTADGGAESRCGWLRDRFGLSWQIIPTALGQLMGDPDQEKSARVRQTMMTMNKIDVAALEAAHRGE
ncbi:VOC family protein [Nakamurella sp. PAMC28650]|nr:VOC family protein [Nakamurella sp. PAMC28650]